MAGILNFRLTTLNIDEFGFFSVDELVKFP